MKILADLIRTRSVWTSQTKRIDTTYQVTVIWNTVITTEDWFQEVYSGFVRIIVYR